MDDKFEGFNLSLAVTILTYVFYSKAMCILLKRCNFAHYETASRIYRPIEGIRYPLCCYWAFCVVGRWKT